MNKETHHSSGDGSDHSVDSENTDYDTETHEDKKQLPIDGEDDNLYFDNTNISTSTDRKIISSTTEDDEDSQFNFYFIMIFNFKFLPAFILLTVTVISDLSKGWRKNLSSYCQNYLQTY